MEHEIGETEGERLAQAHAVGKHEGIKEGRLSAFKEMEKFAFENEKKEFKERGFLIQRGKYYAFRKTRKFAEAKMKGE
jgi:hypothetical protein